MSAIDLNLLRVFDALMEEHSVTRAGQRVGLTQSAVSHALSRLRHHFGDPLFVRGPAGMTPTARALEIGPGVHAALFQLHTAILPPVFDPIATEHRFTIATGSYGCAVLAPTLAAKLAVRAPKSELVVRQPSPDIVEQLDSRRADFALWVDDGASERVQVTPLLSENLVWAVRGGHPILDAPVTIEALASLTHVVIGAWRPTGGQRPGPIQDATWEGLRPFEEALAERGLRQKIGVTVPDIYSAIAVAARSDMATLIPRRLGKMSEKMGGLRLIEPPHATPDLSISIMVLRERLGEPAMAWMHDLLIEVAGEI